MQAAIKFIKKYPASIICYLVYTWLCYLVLKLGLDFHDRVLQDPNGHHLPLGEAVMYGYILLGFIAIIFLMVSAINIFIRKQKAFYIILCIIVVAQAFAVIIIDV